MSFVHLFPSVTSVSSFIVSHVRLSIAAYLSPAFPDISQGCARPVCFNLRRIKLLTAFDLAIRMYYFCYFTSLYIFSLFSMCNFFLFLIILFLFRDFVGGCVALFVFLFTGVHLIKLIFIFTTISTDRTGRTFIYLFFQSTGLIQLIILRGLWYPN